MPVTDEARQWYGWGTRLRPTHESILLARKPIAEKKLIKNILSYGIGGINIEACRIGDEGGVKCIPRNNGSKGLQIHGGGISNNVDVVPLNKGRFPTNTIVSKEVAETLGKKAKFFFCPKVSQKEKHAGCEHLAKTDGKKRGNTHSTVKPIDLMEYLVKLITPPGGTCIDIFMGTGTTGIACSNLGFEFIGIEKENEYFEIAKARIQHWQNVKKRA